MTERAPRFCPQCDAETVELLCSADGSTTLMRHPPDFDLDRDAKIGLVVANRYRLAKELGRGGFGAVFSAQHTGTGQQVAIKLLSAQGDMSQQKRFFREARVTASLKSRHTIRVMDFGQDDLGLSYLAMELLTGRTVDAWLNERTASGQALTESEAVGVGIAVCKSLGEAHLAGLVHRDMKPQNLFCAEIEDGLTIKVLDFGIVKVNDQSMTGDSIIGTTNYMSPEQAMSQKLDGRSDLYSLGVVLYELVSGRLPFEGETPVQTLVAHIQQAPPPLAERVRSPVSSEFLQIIDNLLSKKPEQRFANATELLAALNAMLPHASTELGPARTPSGAASISVDDNTVASPAVTGAGIAAFARPGIAPERAASSQSNPAATAIVGAPAGTVILSAAPTADKKPAYAMWIGIAATVAAGAAVAALMTGQATAPTAAPSDAPALGPSAGAPATLVASAAVPLAPLPTPAPVVVPVIVPVIVPAVEPAVPASPVTAPAAPPAPPAPAVVADAPVVAPTADPAGGKTSAPRKVVPKKGGNALHRDL